MAHYVKLESTRVYITKLRVQAHKEFKTRCKVLEGKINLTLC